jgi:outer membrane protein assembly factor BamB
VKDSFIAKMITALFIAILMTSIMLCAIPTQAQWYIDDEQHGMGWWGKNAKNLQEGGGLRLPSGVTPDMQLKMDPYLSFRPNPVGVGQPILVNVWTVPGPSFVRYFTDLKVTLTKPDGTTDEVTFDTFRADSTGYFEYVVDQAGTWKLKLDIPGQYFPAGNYTMPEGTSQAGYTDSYTRSLYYKPASTAEQTLIVQEDMVPSWPMSSLPTDYWTRPIPPEHREWWTIGGNYPWQGPSGGPTWDELYPDTYSYYTAYTGFFAGDNQRFTPWVQAPNTAHIVWKRQIQLSGLLGGDQGYESMTSGSGAPNIIYQGKGYQTVTKPFDGVAQSVWQCYDIRTGEIFWERTGVTAPTVIEYGEGLPAVPGATAAIGITPALISISGGRLIKYNPSTGAATVNVSIPTWASVSGFSSSIYYSNGYALGVQELNATGGPGEYGTPTAGIYRLINWTTFGNSNNFTSRIISNISWPAAYLGDMVDFGSGRSFRVAETSWFDTPVTGFPYAYIPYDNASGIRYGTRIKAFDLKTGVELWDKNFYESIYHPSASIAYNGKLAILTQDQEGPGGGYYMCFNQANGDLLWKSEQMDSPWDVPGFGAYSISTAYGMIFRFGYSGVYAFDWDTGKIVWKYEAPAFSSYETPYTDKDGNTMYSFNAGGWVADGKLYAVNTEHTPSQPITRGWGLHCINVTTGELIWKIKTAGSIGAVADGYLTLAGQDGILYVYGKGKSATTVTAPDIAALLGSKIVIRGTVLDMSPAQPNTPCISKDSMTTQMEYLHRQMPIAGLWNNETITGVPVSLDAVDPNGNSIHIGDALTDGYSGTFGYTWEPEIAGQYTITATFMGDDSYGSSFATTYVTISEAPQASATATPSTVALDAVTNTLMITVIVGVVAIIIAIAIVGILLMKKR